jgi:predicted dithiol-disulfide oxidoreductase (DUF899 family)
VTEHRIGTRDEWLAARRELLEREKELTRRSDELAQQRRELPWVPVEKEYIFQTDEGEKDLEGLFAGRSQLLVYHFMFGPDFEAGCPVCSNVTDSFRGFIVHLNQHDVTMLCVSRAPLEKLQRYKRRMDWEFPWVSSHENDFNFDFGVSFTEQQMHEGAEYNFQKLPDPAPLLEAESGPIVELARDVGTDTAKYLGEGPGMSAFGLSDGVVYHTYSAYARGLDALWGMYQWLDRAPKGRNEDDPLWMRRHDEYEVAAQAGR